MDEKKLHHKYATKEERLAAWQEQRARYDEWRHTPQGEQWVTRKSNSQLGLCFICMTQLKPPIHVDHIFPLYLGGTSGSANMCITHAECNMRKGVKVYMTYKEANRRRRLFNDLHKGVKAYRIIKGKPTYSPTKREAKGLKLIAQYFTEQQLDSLVPIDYKKQSHEERLAKRREKQRALKNITIGNKKMQEELAYELKEMLRED